MAEIFLEYPAPGPSPVNLPYTATASRDCVIMGSTETSPPLQYRRCPWLSLDPSTFQTFPCPISREPQPALPARWGSAADDLVMPNQCSPDLQGSGEYHPLALPVDAMGPPKQLSCPQLSSPGCSASFLSKSHPERGRLYPCRRELAVARQERHLLMPG